MRNFMEHRNKSIVKWTYKQKSNQVENYPTHTKTQFLYA